MDDLRPARQPESAEAAARFRELVIELYYAGQSDFLKTEAGQKDLENILHNRVAIDRSNVAPWLIRTRPIAGARILEIGCGTGSSTLAIAEQGAEVVGIDILEPSLRVAEARCRLHGIDTVEFVRANAADLPPAVKNRPFDWIIFFASLEHMTYDERLKALADSWAMLPSGGLLCCIDTPNRCWYNDTHTALLPFYHWLPDELAIRYARFSPRASFNSSFGDGQPTADAELRLIRAGRGVSFHEFEIAIAPVRDLKIVSCANQWLLGRVTGDKPVTEGYQLFIKSLLELAPGIHPGWFFNSLDLVIEKP